jgi:tetratricopeptide (TPR) repeat protein
MAHQQYEEALPILSGIIGKNAGVTEAYALRAVCCSHLEEFERAIRYFREYLKKTKEPAPLDYHRQITMCMHSSI